MPRTNRALLLGLLLAPWLSAGCVTPVTEADVETKLEKAAQPFSSLGARRVIPIYAETTLVARALLTEAKVNPESPFSVRVGRRMALAAKRHFHVVVGGPYPQLSDRILTNALQLTRDRGLRGLTVVFVSADKPSPALAEAAQLAKAKLHHREFH
jgi:hypothetical protein